MNKLKNIKKKYFLIGFGILVLIGMINSSLSRDKSVKEAPVASETTNQAVTDTPEVVENPVKEKAEDVELLSTSDDGKWQVFAYLYNSSDRDEVTLHNRVLALREECSKPCMIELYDDKSAYEKNAEYDKMMGSLDTPQASLAKWKEDNYVFVAEHYLGYTDYNGEEFYYYPFKDWYYEELKAK